MDITLNSWVSVGCFNIQILGAIAEYSPYSLVLQKTVLTQTKTLILMSVNLNVRKQDLNSKYSSCRLVWAVFRSWRKICITIFFLFIYRRLSQFVKSVFNYDVLFSSPQLFIVRLLQLSKSISSCLKFNLHTNSLENRLTTFCLISLPLFYFFPEVLALKRKICSRNSSIQGVAKILLSSFLFFTSHLLLY